MGIHHQAERDKLDSSEGSLNVFVIPPPRPKKRPHYPYPRKAVNPIKNVEMKAGSPPQDVTGVERSPPTSVTSASASASASTSTSLMLSRLSPTSCTTDDVLLMENDNECLTSNNTSFEQDKRSHEHIRVKQAAPALSF